jgi:phosphoglycerate dehydrogenase-like enzyme
MTSKPRVVVDPHFRTMQEIFAPADLQRLHAIVDVIWGSDEPMPLDQARAALADAIAVVASGWRYGELPDAAASLRAIIDVSGGFPQTLDYARCFARGIRVLSAAPAFGPQVAEMALAMALSASREIVAGDRAMRMGEERWLHAGNASTFMLYGRPVGFIGYGSIARCLRPLLAPFGCSIAVYDPWIGAGFVLEERFKAAIDVFPIEPLPTEHPIRQAPGAVLSAHRAGSVTEGLWELGRMVVDDLEAIAQGLPPQRLQLAQPELVERFATNRVPRPSA